MSNLKLVKTSKLSPADEGIQAAREDARKDRQKAYTAKVKKSKPVKKAKTSNARQPYYAARINFSTLDIYVRIKKTRPSIAEQYTKSISPAGNIYAKTESEVFDGIEAVLRDHASKVRAMIRHLDQPKIPAVFTENQVDGRHISLQDDE